MPSLSSSPLDSSPPSNHVKGTGTAPNSFCNPSSHIWREDLSSTVPCFSNDMCPPTTFCDIRYKQCLPFFRSPVELSTVAANNGSTPVTINATTTRAARDIRRDLAKANESCNLMRHPPIRKKTKAANAKEKETMSRNYYKRLVVYRYIAAYFSRKMIDYSASKYRM